MLCVSGAVCNNICLVLHIAGYNLYFYSFTYYNILESPKFVGLQNYINLILQDDVFLIGVKIRLSLLLSQDRWAISPLSCLHG